MAGPAGDGEDPPERWAPVRIRCIELYEASTLGRIRNKNTMRVLSSTVERAGYVKVGLYGRGKRIAALVHRAVASAFLPDWDPALTVDHINKDRGDNRVQNLRMATRAQQNANKCHVNTGRNLRVPVEQYTADGRLVAAHASVKAAALSVGAAKCYAPLMHCLAGKRPSFQGFVWRYPEHVDLPGEGWKLFNDRVTLSSLGRYRRKLQNGLWGPALSPSSLCITNGYPVFVSGKKHWLLHVAVARTFLPAPFAPYPAMVVNHRDGDRANAAAANLEWVSQSDNVRHAHATGLLVRDTRPVRQLTLDGKIVATHPSAKAAACATGSVLGSVYRIIHKKRKTLKGCVFEYV